VQYRPEDADFARYLHSRRNTEEGGGDEYEGDEGSAGAFRVPDYSGLVDEDEDEDVTKKGTSINQAGVANTGGSLHVQTEASNVSASGRHNSGAPRDSQSVNFSQARYPGTAGGGRHMGPQEDMGQGQVLAGGYSQGDVVRVMLDNEDSQLSPPTPGSVASGRMSRVGGVFFTALRRSFAEGGEEEDDNVSILSARWVGATRAKVVECGTSSCTACK
jgi:hypothetical protein